VRVTRVSAGEVVYPPGGTLGLRRQHDVQLVLRPRGQRPDHGRRRGAARSDRRVGGLLLPGHEEHFAFAGDRPARHAWVQAGLEAPPVVLLDRLQAPPAALPASAALTALVGEAVAAARAPQPAAGPLLAALALAAVWRYAGEGEAGQPGDAVDRARRVVHVRLADPGSTWGSWRTRRTSARPTSSGASAPSWASRPSPTGAQRRVTAGIDLLANTGLPVGDVAARAGFKSVYHFSRRVKAQAGVSPTRLRRDRWREDRPDKIPPWPPTPSTTAPWPARGSSSRRASTC
jgi:AraC family transcriptional regulator of arabinose operon